MASFRDKPMQVTERTEAGIRYMAVCPFCSRLAKVFAPAEGDGEVVAWCDHYHASSVDENTGRMRATFRR